MIALETLPNIRLESALADLSAVTSLLAFQSFGRLPLLLSQAPCIEYLGSCSSGRRYNLHAGLLCTIFQTLGPECAATNLFVLSLDSPFFFFGLHLTMPPKKDFSMCRFSRFASLPLHQFCCHGPALRIDIGIRICSQGLVLLGRLFLLLLRLVMNPMGIKRLEL
jgi:hypothetical protein